MATYDFKHVEKKWLEFWSKEKTYKFKPGKKIYSIDTPPPTLSGNMHIGHAFSYSQQDFIARFQRMFSGSVFYPFGTDDNGLPTERLIEKIKNVKSKEMKRHEFIELCLKTLKEIRPDFISDWKNLGISCDYDLYYSTIDDNSRKISQSHFVELFNKGLVYKKDFPTIWCPECQTSIAQAELEDKELSSFFSTIVFKVGKDDLLIATTRPELIQACVAVFVNPNDKRYKKFIGKHAVVPLFGFEVPIIADSSAEIDKGTGAMMVCSYGDKYDVEAIARHKLSPKIIFNKDGTIKEGDYKGMKVKVARKAVLETLQKKGLIKERKDIKHNVNVHDKCGTEIEFLPTSQWFVKVLDKKKEWINQGKKIIWQPEFMFKRYENWVNGLEWDWNISRDRYFGIPIPVWECEDCRELIIAEEKELPLDPLQVKKKCPKCNKNAKPEEKVLDTWATSSLTPQIVSSLAKGSIKLPMSLRPQAHDIIRTWTFYTIVRSYLHEGKLPWGNIILSGFVTLQGEKMSKSKGNVINPREVLSRFGADALRFAAASSKLGEDLDYQEKDLVTGQKFINKLLNASNFVFMNLKDYNGQKPKKLESIDKMFLEELEVIVENCTNAFLNYEYFKAKSEVESFFWKMFCDNYLEIVKKRVYNSQGDKKISAQYTLYRSLLTILKLISPIMPFITEEIYQEHFRKLEKDKSIHLSKWPDIEKGKAKANEVYFFESIVELLSRIRQEKTNSKKAMNSECVITLPKSDIEKIKDCISDLKDVTNAREIKEGKFRVEFL